MGEGVISNADCLLVPREEKRDGQKNRYDVNDKKIKELVSDLYGADHRLIICAKDTGAC